LTRRANNKAIHAMACTFIPKSQMRRPWKRYPEDLDSSATNTGATAKNKNRKQVFVVSVAAIRFRFPAVFAGHATAIVFLGL
jgi:hypothetical protein